MQHIASGQREAGLHWIPTASQATPALCSDRSHFPCGHTRRLPVVFPLTDPWSERSPKTEPNHYIALPPLGAGDILVQRFLNFLQIFFGSLMKAMAVFLEKSMLIHTHKIFPYNFKMYSLTFSWGLICHSSRTTWLGVGRALLGNGADDTATQSSDCKGNQGPANIQRAVSNINSHFQGHGQRQVTSRPLLLKKEWPLKNTRVHSHRS